MNSLQPVRNHCSAVEHFQQLYAIPFQEQSLEHIAYILRCFARLPYENISKIIKLNRNWESDHFRLPEELIEDHAAHQLGGTCFSLTYTLKAILDFFGYQTEFLLADMRAGPNTHCALLLNFNRKEYLLDPGYLLSQPLEIEGPYQPNTIQLRRDEQQRYWLWTPNGKQLKRCYSFLKTPTNEETFHHHWEHSFHWRTMHAICLSRRDASGFLYLHNHYLKRAGSDLIFKGNFAEEISAVVCKYFQIPAALVRKAEIALRENLHHDRNLGYQVPEWIK